tara:strand:- start:372 stop:905 length:534 start_codon:yes stop_codon:yes gene_type:complete
MIRKDIKSTIKEYFFENPTSKLRVRQIEKKLKLPLPSIIRYCKELKEESILTTLETENVIFYTADKTNKAFLLEKKLFNIKKVYTSDIIDHLKKELNNPIIILFGSYAKGEDIEESDIDLYIETPSQKKIILDKYEKYLNRKIHILKHKNINEIKNKNLANNILNGITLNKYIEVFK